MGTRDVKYWISWTLTQINQIKTKKKRCEIAGASTVYLNGAPGAFLCL